MTGRITRRRFAAAAAALPALGVPWPAAAARNGRGDDRLAALAELGRLALARGVAEADDPQLQALMGLLSPPGRAADRLRQAIAEDFARGAIVRLDGWVLSATEVRLGVLAHLGWTDPGRPAGRG